jgi:hypothetical protein
MPDPGEDLKLAELEKMDFKLQQAGRDSSCSDLLQHGRRNSIVADSKDDEYDRSCPETRDLGDKTAETTRAGSESHVDIIPTPLRIGFASDEDI